MEIIRDARELDWKMAPRSVNVSVCLLTSHPILNVIFTFAPLGVVRKMYEDNKWRYVISNLKQFSVDMPILYFDFLCRK